MHSRCSMRNPYETDVLSRETHERRYTWVYTAALVVAVCIAIAALVTWKHAAG